jgi:hypothetical protein
MFGGRNFPTRARDHRFACAGFVQKLIVFFHRFWAVSTLFSSFIFLIFFSFKSSKSIN